MQPWDILPQLKPPPARVNVAAARADAAMLAAAGFGRVGVLTDVIIMPRGWTPETPEPEE